MSINQRDIEEALTPAADVLTSQVEHTAELIGEDDPETTRRKLRAHLTQFYEATAKELAGTTTIAQHYKIVKVEQTGDVDGVYRGQRVIIAPVCDGYLLAKVDQ